MKILYTLLLFCFSLSSYSQIDLTLEKAISLALANNFDIQIADESILIAQKNDTWARAGRVVTIDLNANFNNNWTQDNNPASFLRGTFYNAGAGISADASFLLYAGGRVKFLKKQLETATQQQLISKQQQIQELIRVVTQQYYDIVVGQEQLQVIQQSLELSTDQLAYEDAKRDFGASNTFNLLQFKNAVLVDSISLRSQRLAIINAQQSLISTLNLDGDAEFRITDRLQTTTEQIDEEKLAEILIEENYTLKSLEVLASVNRLNTELARANRKPTVNLNASIGAQENAFDYYGPLPTTGEEIPLTFSNRFSGGIGATASWNAYDGGVRNADVQTALMQEEIDVLSMEEAKVQLRNQLSRLVKNYDIQQELLQLSATQLEISNENLLIVEERFRSGQITSLDYRNVQLQTLNAAIAKTNAIYNLLLTKNEIDFLVGTYAK